MAGVRPRQARPSRARRGQALAVHLAAGQREALDADAQLLQPRQEPLRVLLGPRLLVRGVELDRRHA